MATSPPMETRRHETPENQAWLGRVANVIEQWDAHKAPLVRQLIQQSHAVMARESAEAFRNIGVLLEQARQELRTRVIPERLRGYCGQLKAQEQLISNLAGKEVSLQVSITLLRLVKEISDAFPELRLQSFEANGRPDALLSQLAVAIGAIESLLSDSGTTSSTCARVPATDPQLVFVIHGRQRRGDIYDFLRSLGLKTLEWSEARRRTGRPNPYTWEVVDRALTDAGAIVAFLTPDDEARLIESLWQTDDSTMEKELHGQPRQNVLFEAGVAFGRAPERTILIRVGDHRPMIDLAGHHILQLQDSPESRQAVADALRTAGCPVDVSNPDWYRAGTFSS